jgi:hypothetical protein
MENADPIQLLNSIDPEQITLRLSELEAERESLRVLLRAALARRRQRPKDDGTAGKEVRDAS